MRQLYAEPTIWMGGYQKQRIKKGTKLQTKPPT